MFYFTKSDDSISKLKKPIIPFLILILVIVVGTVGYNIIWRDTDSTIIDELYMTFITITTIGFNEIYPLDTTGRIFTIIIGVSGIASLFYILGVMMENLVIIQLGNYRGKRKMKKILDQMENHFIIVGYGRVGKTTASELLKNKKPFVVVTNDLDDGNKDNYDRDSIFVMGDATNDDILKACGVERAKGIIITTSNPSVTVFVVLSAKVLNPNLFIVARSDHETDNEKLRRAGANRVVNPYAIGGQRLANLVVNKNVVDFIESSLGSGDDKLGIEFIELSENCDWFGKTLKELDVRNSLGATILAVIRDGKPIVNPGAEFIIENNDKIVAFGTKSVLKDLNIKT